MRVLQITNERSQRGIESPLSGAYSDEDVVERHRDDERRLWLAGASFSSPNRPDRRQTNFVDGRSAVARRVNSEESRIRFAFSTLPYCMYRLPDL